MQRCDRDRTAPAVAKQNPLLMPPAGPAGRAVSAAHRSARVHQGCSPWEAGHRAFGVCGAPPAIGDGHSQARVRGPRVSLPAAGTCRCRPFPACSFASQALPARGGRHLFAAGMTFAVAGLFLRSRLSGWHCQAGLWGTVLRSRAAGSLQLTCLPPTHCQVRCSCS